MTSTEAGICVQLHTPTLTIPVDPEPGPDLIQIYINPQPFRWGCEDVKSGFGWLHWLSCGHLPKNFVTDRVNTRIAHNNYVTCT